MRAEFTWQYNWAKDLLFMDEQQQFIDSAQHHDDRSAKSKEHDSPIAE